MMTGDPPSWYYSWDNRPRGPADLKGLQVLAEQGFLNGESWVWRESWLHWQRLDSSELQTLLVFGPPGSLPLVPPPLPLPPPLPIARPPRGQLRQFGFNLLVFCGAFAALTVAVIPLFSSLSLPFSVPIAGLAVAALVWSIGRKTSKTLPALALFFAFLAMALGARNYRAENHRKPTLTELLAIHDRGTPRP